MRSRYLLITAIIGFAAIGYCVSPAIFGKDMPKSETTENASAQKPSADTAVQRKTAADKADNSAPKGRQGDKTSADSQRKLEMPRTQKGETLIAHTGFVLSYDREHNVPRWVAWQLTRDETEGTIPRAKDFLPDPQIDARHRVTTDDYKNSGYDRGHMVPAADMHWNARAMTECFYLTNICPQDHSLNAGAWATLEKACRRWAKQEGAVYIVCGPIFDSNRKAKTIGQKFSIGVPNAFFKVVLSMTKGKEKAIGFVYANRDGKQPMTQTACTVDQVEEITGIDFFCNIDDRLEQRIEATADLKAWR